jgi:hypothetical protein
MAQPEKNPSAKGAPVASCAATDCQHNDDRACTADEIKVALQDGTPVCGTYAPEGPKARP